MKVEISKINDPDTGNICDAVKFIAENHYDIFELGEMFRNLRGRDMLMEVCYGTGPKPSWDKAFVIVKLDDLVPFLCGQAKHGEG